MSTDLSQEQQTVADAAVFVIITAPVDKQVAVMEMILEKYVDSLMAGSPELTQDEIRGNVENYREAIKNRIAELMISGCAGSA